MTTMDSDSESQDSDDGRRFRFEATRKDNVQQQAKLGSTNIEQESQRNNTEHGNERYKTRSDSSREEAKLLKDRNNDNRDLKRSTRYLLHSPEPRGSKREDGKDYKNPKDAGSNSRSGPVYTKHRIREAKRHRSRERDEHWRDRSQEQSRGRNENDRSQNGKHRNKSHEKHKYHSSDRNREKSYQSYRERSVDDGKFRGASERYGTDKRQIPMKDDNEQRLEESATPTNTGRGQSGNELLTKRDFSVECQEYKELDSPEFDILSETDGNMSDSSDARNESPSLQERKSGNAKKRYLNSGNDSLLKKHVIDLGPMEVSPKVNAGRNNASHGSSNNNSGTISDTTLGTASSVFMELRKNAVDTNSEEDNLHADQNTSLQRQHYDPVKAAADAVPLSDMDVETEPLYGPVLPPLSTPKSSDNDAEKNVHFIGPCLPANGPQSGRDEEKDVLNRIARGPAFSWDSDTEKSTAFGPALPPHLLKSEEDENDATAIRIIGPALPNAFNTSEIDQAESEDEDGIGPLPADHPALETKHVYRQLERRAQRIKSDQMDQVCDMVVQREEWMTELPPTRLGNLGLTSRKFRAKAGPDMSDRSCWTDTPAKRAEKEKRKAEEKIYDSVGASIREQSEGSDEPEPRESEKREKSLLEIHQSKLRKKKKKEEKRAKETGQTLRRPFDRDVDLQVNRFDNAAKNAIIKKAQNLDERFSRGKY